MATAWFIQRNEKAVGPLSAQQLREIALAGKLQSDDLVRKGEVGEFTPASRIKNLFAPDQVASRPTPPPPRLPSLVVSEGQAPSALGSVVSSPESGSRSEGEPAEPVSGSEPVAASESWFSRLLPYLTTVREKLADFGDQAMQAGALGKLVARRTQLQQHQLPQAFSALGAHLYHERRFAEEFVNHFAEIDEAVSQQSQLAGAGVPEGQLEDLAGKVKGAAEGLLRRGKSASIGLKLKTLHRKLGEAVYQQHGPDSGPAELVSSIEKIEAEIRELQKKVNELEAAGQGRVLTPRRLLVGGVVACVLVGLMFAGRFAPIGDRSTGTGSSTAASSSSTPQNETFLERLEEMGGRARRQPLPDRDRRFFWQPREYSMVNADFYYDEWVEAFGEPEQVRTGPDIHSYNHVWQHQYGNETIHVCGVLETAIHHRSRMKHPAAFPRSGWRVVVIAVSVD